MSYPGDSCRIWGFQIFYYATINIHSPTIFCIRNEISFCRRATQFLGMFHLLTRKRPLLPFIEHFLVFMHCESEPLSPNPLLPLFHPLWMLMSLPEHYQVLLLLFFLSAVNLSPSLRTLSSIVASYSSTANISSFSRTLLNIVAFFKIHC